jgi:hypothetical protein
MASVAMVRTKAIRRFRVMNWRRIWPVTRAATERASRADWVRGRETMMAELYFPGRSEQPERAYLPGHLPSDLPLRIRAQPRPAVLSLLIACYDDATSP